VTRTARTTLLGLSLVAFSSCTLIQRPDPVTTLQVTLADESLRWPAVIALGKVDSVSALRSNRILVIDGAKLMQHDGLRWIDTPAVMLSEQLRALHARATATEAATGSLDVWLGDFNLRVAADGSREAVAGAHASLRCSDADRILTIAPVAASASLASSDPQALADAFAGASTEVAAALLSQAETLSAGCENP
jgi:hypothetical protein